MTDPKHEKGLIRPVTNQRKDCNLVPGNVRQSIGVDLELLSEEERGPYAEKLILGGVYPENNTSFTAAHCPTCRLCVPCRVDLKAYIPSTTLKKIAEKNEKLGVKWNAVAPEDASRHIHRNILYNHRVGRSKEEYNPGSFQSFRKQYSPMRPNTIKGAFDKWQKSTILPPYMLEFKAAPIIIGALLAYRMPETNSFYGYGFYYNPWLIDKDRSIGIYMIDSFFRHAAAQGADYAYMAYTATEGPYKYKSQRFPMQVYIDGEWIDRKSVPDAEMRRAQNAAKTLAEQGLLDRPVEWFDRPTP